jgi:glutaredoxin
MELYNNSKYVIYGSTTCRFCRQAEQELEAAQETYQKVYIEDHWPDRTKFFQDMASCKGSYPNTIPLIFYHGSFMGGATALSHHLRQISSSKAPQVTDDF